MQRRGSEPLKETLNETQPEETCVEPANDCKSHPNWRKGWQSRHLYLRVRPLHLPASTVESDEAAGHARRPIIPIQDLYLDIAVQFQITLLPGVLC